MLTADELKAATPIEPFLRQKGIVLHGQGSIKTTNRCPLKEHKPGHDCVSVNVEENWFNCNDCPNTKGTVIDWEIMEKGMTAAQVIKAFDTAPPPSAPRRPRKIAACYSYRNELGHELYQCVRYEPKGFEQRHSDGKGGWIWSVKGIRHVLYHLPDILKENSGPIVITEGEKDAETLKLLGLTSTTSVGGSKNWMDGYADVLKGKDVVICGDTDTAGQIYISKVAASLEGKVRSLRIITGLLPLKDITEFLARCKSPEEARDEWDKLFAAAPVLSNGLNLPILSMEEMEAAYRDQIKRSAEITLDLSRWLPSLGRHLRGILPGEVITLLAGTGVGKTAWAANLAMHASPIPVLFFEMELTAALLFERLAACDSEKSCTEIEKIYGNGDPGSWRANGRLSHIYTVPEAKMTSENMSILINKAELKMGVRPVIVIVDYMQLVGAEGKTRYERASFVAEQLKIIAKDTKTIIVCLSQIARPPVDKHGHRREVVTLESGKDSGSIENSSGLVIGAWRPNETTIRLCILKNTKGRSGATIDCNFDGETMVITEKSKIEDEDVPAPTELEMSSRTFPYADK